MKDKPFALIGVNINCHDPKKLKELVDAWGKLPERDRIKAMTEMTRDLPPAYRQMIEDYFRKLASEQGGR